MLQEGLKGVRKGKGEVNSALSKLEVLKRSQHEAIQHLVTGKARYGRLGEEVSKLLQAKGHIRDISEEAAVGEVLQGTRAARDLRSRDTERVRDVGALRGEERQDDVKKGEEVGAAVTEANRSSPSQGVSDLSSKGPINSNLSSSDAGFFPGNFSGFSKCGADAQSRGNDTGQGNQGASSQGNGSQGNGNQGNSHQGTAASVYGSGSARPSDFADQLSELKSWSGASGSGVTFSFSSSTGRKLNVQLTHVPEKGTVVALAPESLADQRIMGGALREVRRSLEQHGLHVSGAHVGALRKKGPYA